MNRKPTTKKSINQRKKNSTKIKATTSPKEAIVSSDSFHETFPITLEYMDGKDFKRCFFVCKEHCDTHLKRYGLKKDSYKLFDTKPKDD